MLREHEVFGSIPNIPTKDYKMKLSDYEKYKNHSRLCFLKFHYGMKQRKCGACNGSGRYDHNGSPKCGGCEGTGKETYRGNKSLEVLKFLDHLTALVKEETVYSWLAKRNKSFGNLNPIQMIQSGRWEELWNMIHELESGMPQ